MMRFWSLPGWPSQSKTTYSGKAGHFKPMDMEWAKDGATNQLFIVQARPETVHSQKDRTKLKEYILTEKGEVLIKGRSVGQLIGSGKAQSSRMPTRLTSSGKAKFLLLT
jgi:pyruvate,water dikinase